jgi:hypothetical protein
LQKNLNLHNFFLTLNKNSFYMPYTVKKSLEQLHLNMLYTQTYLLLSVLFHNVINCILIIKNNEPRLKRNKLMEEN